MAPRTRWARWAPSGPFGHCAGTRSDPPTPRIVIRTFCDDRRRARGALLRVFPTRRFVTPQKMLERVRHGPRALVRFIVLSETASNAALPYAAAASRVIGPSPCSQPAHAAPLSRASCCGVRWLRRRRPIAAASPRPSRGSTCARRGRCSRPVRHTHGAQAQQRAEGKCRVGARCGECTGCRRWSRHLIYTSYK